MGNNLIKATDIKIGNFIIKDNIVYKITCISTGKIKSRPLLITACNKDLQKEIYEIISSNSYLHIDSSGNIELLKIIEK